MSCSAAVSCGEALSPTRTSIEKICRGPSNDTRHAVDPWSFETCVKSDQCNGGTTGWVWPSGGRSEITIATPAAGKLAAATAVSVPEGADDAAALFVINVPCAGPRGAGTVVAPARHPGGTGIVQPSGEMKICEGSGRSNVVSPGTVT